MRNIIALLCLLLPVMGLAWAGQTDYLAQLQNAAPADRLTVARRIYNEQIIHLDSAQAFVALNRINKWATNTHDAPLKIFSLIAMGDYHKEYFSHEAGDNALQFFTAALEIASQQDLKAPEAEFFNNMGWLYYKQDKFPQAFEYKGQ